MATRNAIVQASTDRPKWLEYTAGFFPVIFFIFILFNIFYLLNLQFNDIQSALFLEPKGVIH